MNKFLNPFRYLSLKNAMCWGVAALILSAIFFWQVGLRLTSLTQINYAGGSLISATIHQIMAWLIFVVVLYVAAVAMSKSKVRIQDVAAFNLFARIPFDLSMIVFAFPSVRSVMGLMMDGSLESALQHTTLLSVVSMVSLVCVVWYMLWSYKAFAEATNLKNGKGVAIFAVCFVVAYVISPFVLRLV